MYSVMHQFDVRWRSVTFPEKTEAPQSLQQSDTARISYNEAFAMLSRFGRFRCRFCEEKKWKKRECNSNTLSSFGFLIIGGELSVVICWFGHRFQADHTNSVTMGHSYVCHHSVGYPG